jgi:hypothetical protein
MHVSLSKVAVVVIVVVNMVPYSLLPGLDCIFISRAIMTKISFACVDNITPSVVYYAGNL